MLRSFIVIALLAAACGGQSAFELEVGDCFDDPSNFEEVETVPATECSQPHDNEVYGNYDIAEATWPGQSVVEDWADETCYEAFETYVGTSYQTSSLDFGWLIPTQTSWDRLDDRTVTCFLYDLDLAKLSGSMRNTSV